MSPLVFLVAAAHAVNDHYMGFLSVLYPVIRQKFALSLPMIGTVSMVAGIASALSQPAFGALFDRRNVAVSLHLAPLLTAVFICLLSLAPNVPVLLGMLFLGCLGSAAFHPKGASITPVLSRSRPEIGMAVFSAAGNLGLAAGPTVIAFFIAAWGWHASPWLILPAAFVVALLFVLLPPRQINEHTRGRTEITLRGLAADRAGLAAVLRLVFINFCITVGLRGLQTYLGILLTDLGSTVTTVGLVLSVTLALGAFASIYVSSLVRRFGSRALVASSILVGPPLGIAGILLLPSPIGWVLTVLSGMALAWSNPVLILKAQRHAGDSPAMASSLQMGLAWGLAGIAMVPLGALGELIGTRTLLVVSSMVPLLGLFSCFRLPHDRDVGGGRSQGGQQPASDRDVGGGRSQGGRQPASDRDPSAR
jgi:FSR family fosmidomycin resistance protein-like MFS transporter